MKNYPCLNRMALTIALTFLHLETNAETFQIVTDANCTTTADGTLSQCHFPEIEIKDLEEQRIPLPYETVVKTRTSQSCQLNAVNAALQIRFGARGPIASNFLRYENLSMDHNRRLVLTHARSQALGSISVFPREVPIFENIVFSKDCQITIEVKLNRIALKSRMQADEHIRTLNQELDNLKRSHAALTEIRLQRQQALDSSSLIARFHQLSVGLNRSAELEALRLHWSMLLNPLRTSLAAQHGQHQLEGLDDLSAQLNAFTNVLDQAISSAELPTELNNLLSQSQRNHPHLPHAQGLQIFEADYLNQMAQRLRNAELEIQLVTNSVELLFPAGEISQPLDEEFQDVFLFDLVGPHGAIDKYLHDLSMIGRT